MKIFELWCKTAEKAKTQTKSNVHEALVFAALFNSTCNFFYLGTPCSGTNKCSSTWTSLTSTCTPTGIYASIYLYIKIPAIISIATLPFQICQLALKTYCITVLNIFLVVQTNEL